MSVANVNQDALRRKPGKARELLINSLLVLALNDDVRNALFVHGCREFSEYPPVCV